MRTETIFLGIVILFFVLSYAAVFVSDAEAFAFLTEEDGLFEMLAPIFFVVASALLLIAYFRDERGNDLYWLRTRRNIFFLFLALLFFFAAGEEISWGQRVLDWQTPDAFIQANMQDETNLHNLSIFHGTDAEGNRKSFWGLLLSMERLFTFFWITYCVVIPICDRTLNMARKWIRLLNLPIVPIWIGAMFAINYLVSKAIESYIVHDLAYLHGIVEIKETCFALLFMMVASWFLLQSREIRSRFGSV